MWNNAAEIVRQELAHDEPLLWSGRPGTGFRFQRGDGFMVPFSLIWTGLVAAGLVAALASREPFQQWSILVVFMLVGLFTLFGRYLFDIMVRQRTFYGLSDERAIIVRRWFGTRVQSLSLRTQPEITLSENNGRRGTIFFGSTGPWTMWPGMTLFYSAFNLNSTSFDLIEDARAVFNLARDAQRSVQRPDAPR
jgi:hypothetical protein